MSLTRAEKNAIIINESKGIQHPDYYVCHTKTGGVQVRKRKKKLEVNLGENKIETNKAHIAAETPEPNPVKTNNYDTVSNKQLLDMMIQILDKTTESKDKNLNDVEREKETKENEEFTEGMKMRAEKVIKENLPERTQSVLEARSAEPEIKVTPEIKPQVQQRIPQPRVFRRKGRNLLR